MTEEPGGLHTVHGFTESGTKQLTLSQQYVYVWPTHFAILQETNNIGKSLYLNNSKIQAEGLAT